MTIVKGKGSKVRPVYLGARTVRALDRYIRMRAQHRWAHLSELFLTQRGALSVGSTGWSRLLIGYREFDGRCCMSRLDALHLTIETIGTAGFGDFYFRGQEPWLRGWAIALRVSLTAGAAKRGEAPRALRHVTAKSVGG